MRNPTIAVTVLFTLAACTDSVTEPPPVAVVAPLLAPASQASYTAVDLGTLGGEESVATGINAAGAIVGTSRRPDGGSVAFRWTGREGMQALLDPGAGCSGATDINDRGDIVGWSGGGCTLLAEPGSWGIEPFKLGPGGELTRFPNGRWRAAVSVNNRGDVLGWTGFWANLVWFADGTESRICFGYSMVLFTITDQGAVLGGAYAFAPTAWGGVRWTRPDQGCDSQRGDDTFRTVWISDGNTRGQEVGLGVIWEPDPSLPGGGRALSPWIGFLYTPGRGYQPLDFTPNAISNSGHVVGRREGIAVLRTRDGTQVDLGQGNALAVNDHGDVVGASGDGRAVLWTRRPDQSPQGRILASSTGSRLSAIHEREARSSCPSRFAFMAAMGAFPECVGMPPFTEP